jgi:predicted transcriptional regulator
MRRTKLDLYVAVLKAVDIHGSLNITGLTLRVRLNYVQLKPILNDLIDKGVIEEQHLRNCSIVYAATPLGQRLSTQFKQTLALNTFATFLERKGTVLCNQ